MSPVFSQSELKEGLNNKTIARLVKGAIEAGNFGPQLHIHMDALDFEVGGETGLLQEWFSVKLTKTSKLGAFIQALASIPGPSGEEGYYTMDTNTGTTDVGASLVGPVVGQIFVWETKKLSELVQLGSGMTDSEFRVPIEALTQEQADARIKEQGGKRMKGEGGNGAGTSANGAVAAAAAAPATSDDEKAAMDEYILDQIGDEGMKKAQFVRFAAQDATLKEYPDVKKDVVSLNWAKRHLEAGDLVLDGDTYRRAKVAA